MSKQPNQLDRRLLSSLGLNPFIACVSSSRSQMFASHLGQKLVVNGASERLCQTGMEAEFAKYTFSTKMPADGIVIRVIEKYRRTVGVDSINYNPLTAVIYQDEKTHEYGIFYITNYCSYHPYFGFDYKTTPHINKLVPGNRIAKDTIFNDSPAVTENGNYKYGVELNMAFMSHPSVSEDGVMISRDVLDKFAFKTYETRAVEWGSKHFPLNLYGDLKNFKAFPDIGDTVRDDGLLMVLRSFERTLAPVEQSIYDLMKIDHMFDKATYVAGPGGRVIDIRIHTVDDDCYENHDPMEVQAIKYLNATRDFHRRIVDEYKGLKKLNGQSLQITPAFHRQVVESLSFLDDGNEVPRITRVHRKNPIDRFRAEFVIEYTNVPRDGFKFTDTHGG